MMTFQNKEAELSYAYLYAVCSKAGFSCKQGDRHDDADGIDAIITYRGEISNTYLKNISLNVQLKATIKKPVEKEGYLSYFLQGVTRYDKLRTKDSPYYKVLVVLFLPENPDEWLYISADELIIKKAAYWINLYGQPAVNTTAGTTIYIPTTNILTPQALTNLVQMAVKEYPNV